MIHNSCIIIERNHPADGKSLLKYSKKKKRKGTGVNAPWHWLIFDLFLSSVWPQKSDPQISILPLWSVRLRLNLRYDRHRDTSGFMLLSPSTCSSSLASIHLPNHFLQLHWGVPNPAKREETNQESVRRDASPRRCLADILPRCPNWLILMRKEEPSAHVTHRSPQTSSCCLVQTSYEGRSFWPSLFATPLFWSGDGWDLD